MLDKLKTAYNFYKIQKNKKYEKVRKEDEEKKKQLFEVFYNENIPYEYLNHPCTVLYQQLSDPLEVVYFIDPVHKMKKRTSRHGEHFDKQHKGLIYFTNKNIYFLSNINGIYKEIYKMSKVNGLTVPQFNILTITVGRSNYHFKTSKADKYADAYQLVMSDD